VVKACPEGLSTTTLIVSPATVKVPIFKLFAPFAAAENVTMPLPEPLLTDVIPIQLDPAGTEEVHAHPEDVLTATLPVPPEEEKSLNVGETANVHVAVPSPLKGIERL